MRLLITSKYVQPCSFASLLLSLVPRNFKKWKVDGAGKGRTKWKSERMDLLPGHNYTAVEGHRQASLYVRFLNTEHTCLLLTVCLSLRSLWIPYSGAVPTIMKNWEFSLTQKLLWEDSELTVFPVLKIIFKRKEICILESSDSKLKSCQAKSWLCMYRLLPTFLGYK